MNPVKINDTTYEITLPLGDRVGIGDKDSADFKPCARLNRWGEECSLKLSIPTAEKVLPYVQGEKILWQGRDYGAEFFAATDGFKFNIILPEKPGTNVFPLELGSDNLKFCYQPPLTEEFKEGWSEEFEREILVSETQVTDLDGNVLVNRPENIVGSYAVYHATKGNMHLSQAEAEKYKAGKAFHWYRPLIYDNAGHTCWGILNVDPKAGIRTVTIPQDFLDNAVYPVTVDDQFGYTTKCGTEASRSNTYLRGYYWASPSSSGQATSISAYIKHAASAYLRWGLYNRPTDVPTSLVAQTAEGQITSGWDDWKTLDFASPPSITSGTNYWMAGANSANVLFYYDSVGSAYYAYGSNTYNQGDDLPSTFPSPSLSNYRWSIYCTYTPSGGGEEKTGSDTGTGADAKISGNPLVAIGDSESGSGLDLLPARDITLLESGSGVDAFVSLQTPSAKTASDAGYGVDALVSLQVPQNKTSSDIGSGVEAMPVYSAVLAGSEGGYGIEAFIARILAAAEGGYGAEASEIGGGGLIKKLFASELGDGADGLIAKIEIPTKGGGMRLWT
jgi:hypothetical protein